MTQERIPSLAQLRAQLDRIDDDLLALIESRLAVSRDIARAKQGEGDRHLKIRPRRQAEVLERLNRRVSDVPKELIGQIWRELMAHSLQAQSRTEIILAPSEQPELLEARVRAHFGWAAPVRWATSPSHAIRQAIAAEAIAILPQPPSTIAGEVRVFDVLRDKAGRTIAYAAGRVAAEEAHDLVPEAPAPETEAQPANPSQWTPESWRDRPAQQLPQYADAEALAQVEHHLAGSSPLVSVADVIRLRASLARVAAGESFLLQGGDCAESFAEFSAEKVRVTYNLLLRMGAMLRAAGGSEVAHLARIAGQFAKPRSSLVETIDGVTLPSYRGDAVNGSAFTPESRNPDPKRLLEAHRQAQVTIDLLRAYSSASYADLPAVHRDVGLRKQPRPVSMFTSHEALLLNYEEALVRYDEASENWWATSGHLIWIGDRTRQLDGAHVEFARGIANPVGLKCGPSISVDEMLRLLDRLDPDNVAGRLVLIGRFGASKIEGHLPELMRATRREGRNAIWSIDPMHGNTRNAGSLKTRKVEDILAETRMFFDIAAVEGVHAGGVHLEMAGSDVTECLGGSPRLAEEDLHRNYLTHCDPRLNRAQALDVAAEIADLLAGQADRRSDAA